MGYGATYRLKSKLKLDEEDYKILREQKINGEVFLDMTKEEFLSYGWKGGFTTKFAKQVGFLQTKRSEDLKAMLKRYKIEKNNIKNILSFDPGKVSNRGVVRGERLLALSTGFFRLKVCNFY